jgi:hypothetical protein
MAKSPADLWTRWTALAVLVALAPAWATAQPKSDPKRSQLPAAVVKAIDANCPGAEIDKLDIEDEVGIKLYDVEFKAGRGEIEVAADGRVVEGPKPDCKESRDQQ